MKSPVRFRPALLLAAPPALAAVALAAGPYTVQGHRRERQGQNVVSLAPVGGANGVGAAQGCLNQQLFNGVWRFKVLSVAQNSPLWRLKMEMKFGSVTGGYSTSGTGVLGYNLQLESGKVIPVNSSVVDLRDKGFIPGEGFTTALDFDAGGVSGKPVKLVVPIDPAGVASTSLSYSVKDPSFRVDLTCKK